MASAGETYHQLVLVWLKDAAKFQDYLTRLPPIVARYGGAGDQSYQPTAIRSAGLGLPDVVNLVHYESEEAYERFGADPDFRKIEHLRSESVDLLTFEGRLVHANPAPDGVPGRLSAIDLLADNGGTPAASSPGADGVEYVLAVRSGSVGGERVDLVRISSAADLGDLPDGDSGQVVLRLLASPLEPAAPTNSSPIRRR